ncbi:hypothetical protein DFH06DRAFT_1128611 [Mycena polygramma]|nr:hypothetical protein DFH06DRAFT_1140373 [Mycena polygramma]KAJ7663284.1 hypothetical protein DFH06DRAFT_1128611 [Mycena polygramma]
MVAPETVFPEDIEYTINQLLLEDAADMWTTMSRLASRFRTWTTPAMLRTVVIRLRDDWAKRIDDFFLPHARFIEVLAIDLPATRGFLSGEELSCIRRLLRGSECVRHLAVSWHIWEQLASECGSLQLVSLYLIWDGAYDILPPSMNGSEYRAPLTDITIYAPPQLETRWADLGWAEFYLPGTIMEDLPKLTHMTYATSREVPTLVDFYKEDIVVMWVLVDSPTRFLRDTVENQIQIDMQLHPNASTSYLRSSSEILGQWLAKMEGNPSVLDASSPGWIGRGEWNPSIFGPYN